MIAKIAVSDFKYNLASEDEVSRQLATSGGKEITSIILTAGGSAATVRVVDSANGAAGYGRADGFIVAAEASTSTPVPIIHPIPMKKGIYLIFEQGVGANAECFIAWK